MTLLIFILTYIAVTIVAKYTALGEYLWFNDLESRLVHRFPTREKLIRDVFAFKLFHCSPCQSFWLSVPVFTYFFEDPISIVLALLLYLLKHSNDKQEDGTNDNNED